MRTRHLLSFAVLLAVTFPARADKRIGKTVLKLRPAAENLLIPYAWRAWHRGFEHEGELFVCNNGSDSQAQDADAGSGLVLRYWPTRNQVLSFALA